MLYDSEIPLPETYLINTFTQINKDISIRMLLATLFIQGEKKQLGKKTTQKKP